MALTPGIMSLTVEYAQGIKDKEFLFRQSPYCVITVGSQTFRSEVSRDGGTSPVWNQTFQVNVLNDNEALIELKDHELGPDEVIGYANISFARARECGGDRQNAPVFSRRHNTQHGFISVALQWQPDYAGGYGGGYAPQQPMYGGMPQPAYGGGYGQQPMYGGGMPPQPMYGGGVQETVIVEERPRHHHHHHRREGEEVIIIEEQRW